MTDMITVWDRHGEQFIRPRTVMLWVEEGRLFLECPANPLPHTRRGYVGSLYTLISDDGNEISEYFSLDGLVPAAARTKPLPSRPKRVPIRPVPETSGGRFDAKSEVELLRQIVRQLTDYVNELRRDVDTLQGYGRE